MGKYLYAVIACGEERDFGAIGINNALVQTVNNGVLAAVVSDYSGGKLRPVRANMAAHQIVMNRLMEETTPLPMAFGIIADDEGAVKKILSRNHSELQKQLKRVSNKVEMSLHILWGVPNIFEYFVNTHPELRIARDAFFGVRREPTQEEKIELGRMFDQAVTEDRERHADEVQDVLSDYCSEMKPTRCRNEREVLNLACLIGRNEEAKFEEGVIKAASLFDDNYSFDYKGPWAPHNFVEVELQL